MNVRFAESCNAKHLELEDIERNIELNSIRDGRTEQESRLTCQQDIYIGVFFDGTNNNKYRDTPGFSHSNVARLYEVYPGTPATQTPPKLASNPQSGKQRKVFEDEAFKPASFPAAEYPYYRKIYVPGVGTPMPDVGDSGTGMQKKLGLAMALLGQARLDWALLQVCNQVHAAVFGTELESGVRMESLFKKNVAQLPIMSPPSMIGLLMFLQKHEKELREQMGSYDESAFKEMLNGYERRLVAALKQRGTKKPTLRKIRLSVFGFSRGAAEARAWVNMVEQRWGGDLCLGGIPLQIDFLGIFDTVASVGLAQSTPYANGHFAWADGTNMVVPAGVKRCAHLVAAFEVRGSFPLDSVCQGDSLPSNCKEILYPGVHSDVGGGYPPGDQGRALGQGAAGDCKKISQIPLVQMYREARMAGVPLALEKDMDANRARYLAIDPKLRADFNAYIAATRTGSVKPTLGKGDPQFARMYPTETQPRDTVWRLIRRHHGYLLQWQKTLLSRSGGAASLPGLHNSTSDSKFQDIEDFRGAEEELRKEIAFLQSKDPKKFDVVDDVSLEKAKTYTKYGSAALSYLLPMLARPLTYLAPGALQSAIRSVMQEKQTQWDSWLSRDWAGEDALTGDKAEAAAKLFECYVHDSRAWFKPLFTSDGQGTAPDDEEWFTLGGREKAKSARIRKLNEEVEEHKKSGDKKALAAAEHELKQMQQEGQPLIYGGREPYRMWGYLRHRRIYQSGTLVDASQEKWQSTVEREEEERERMARRERMIAVENARHEKEVQNIKTDSRRVASDPKLRSNNDEYQEGARRKLERENRDHEEKLREINKETAEAAH